MWEEGSNESKYTNVLSGMEGTVKVEDGLK